MDKIQIKTFGDLCEKIVNEPENVYFCQEEGAVRYIYRFEFLTLTEWKRSFDTYAYYYQG